MELLEWLWMAVVFCTLLAPMITFMFIIDDLEDKIEEKGKTIKRMEVWVQNQMDREKELLERIKYLESLTK